MKKIIFMFSVVLFTILLVSTAQASHSWGGYHWARTGNPFALKLGDNVSSAWDNYLTTASSDWTLSSVLDTNVVGGQSNPKNCRPTAGRVEVCNYRYGNNGWLGIAQIWVNGSHIMQGVTKVNDTYFNTSTYNTPAWRSLVMCQEVGHNFGLNHQDETFNNVNLGTCMDYTNAPAGGVINGFNYGASNEHPNAHDYDELGIIYTHFDSFNSALNSVFGKKSSASAKEADDNNDNVDVSNPSEWGKETEKDGKGRGSHFERDLGKGSKVFTFVVWAE